MMLSRAINEWRDFLIESNGSREADSMLKILKSDHPVLSSLTLVEEIDDIVHQEILADLKKGKPIQQICGVAFFYDRLFKVNEHTLIPRPETEELVRLIIKENKKKGISILDIGTGSGCIPIVLKNQLSDVEVTAIDVSLKALEVAKLNALENDVVIKFEVFDFLNESIWDGLGEFDIIVSNPPYIDVSEKDKMPEQVHQFEPDVALFTSIGNPLEFYKKIHAFSNEHLRTNGVIYLEINEFRVVETKAIFQDTFKVTVIKDMQEKPRILKCKKV